MPGFGDKSSASILKMELGSGRYSGKARFSFGNIIGDPFWLGTISIGICGWLIAFVSSIVANIEIKYPNYAWWTLVYMLFCIGGVIYVVGSNTVATYHVALSSFLAAGLVMTTSAVNSLIYESNAAKEAGAAGFILLSIDAIVWIFFFGSQPESSHRQTLSSFALHKDHAPSRNSRANMRQSYRPDTTTSNHHHNHNNNNNSTMYGSHLAGFETSSPVAGFPSNGGISQRQSASAFPAPVGGAQLQPASGLQNTNNAAAAGAGTSAAPTVTQESVNAPSEYPYRAKAIYSYDANPDDANEISFTKHEILDVSDVSGRWWQAKKENGETGIAPSNYLILL